MDRNFHHQERNQIKKEDLLRKCSGDTELSVSFSLLIKQEWWVRIELVNEMITNLN